MFSTFKTFGWQTVCNVWNYFLADGWVAYFQIFAGLLFHQHMRAAGREEVVTLTDLHQLLHVLGPDVDVKALMECGLDIGVTRVRIQWLAVVVPCAQIFVVQFVFACRNSWKKVFWSLILIGTAAVQLHKVFRFHSLRLQQRLCQKNNAHLSPCFRPDGQGKKRP